MRTMIFVDYNILAGEENGDRVNEVRTDCNPRKSPFAIGLNLGRQVTSASARVASSPYPRSAHAPSNPSAARAH
jgi:hypothetical protein